MRERPRVETLCACTAACLLASALGVAVSPSPGQTASSAIPSAEDAAGRAALTTVCTPCHELDLSIRRTPVEWDEVITQMVAYGATGTDEQFAQLKSYLLRTYATVNVNTARARDIAAVLEISTDVAEAIVRYRTERGRFKSLEDVKSVPGVPSGKLEAHRQQITL